jgi:hypothetical protein
MRSAVWELVFFLLILKIPVAYVCCVVWYAVHAKPLPPAGAALVPAETKPGSEPWRPRGTRRLQPRGGGPSRRPSARRPARKAAR